MKMKANKKMILVAGVLATISGSVFATDITLANNHTADSNYNLVSSTGNNVVVKDGDDDTVNNLILGGWSKFQGRNIYNIISGTEIKPTKKNVENIMVGDVINVENSDYGVIVGNRITVTNDDASIKKYGRRSTMAKGDKLTIKNSPFATVMGRNTTVDNSFGSLVVGQDNNVKNATLSVVFGDSATVDLPVAEKGSVFMFGKKAYTNANYTMTMGYGARTTAYSATAIGNQSEASGEYSTALSGGNASGKFAMALGDRTEAKALAAVALGLQATANKNAGVAIGGSANSDGDYATAIGVNSKATATDAIAVGRASKAEAEKGIAIGTNVTAKETSSIAIGHNTEASGLNSIAIGGNTKVSGDYVDTPITKATAEQSIAIGYRAEALSRTSVAIGYGAHTSEGSGTVAIGLGAASIANDGTAVGNGAMARAEQASAFGTISRADGQYSVAVGYNADANSINSISIGNNADAQGDNSIHIGSDNEVNPYAGEQVMRNAVVIGSGNRINSDSTNENMHAERSVVIGSGNSIEDSTDFIAIGGGTVQGSKRSIVMGNNAKVAADNSVALGYDSFAYDVESTASTEINGKTYNFAGSVAHGTVGIGARGEHGERTITGLAAGRINNESTDAINGSQLHAVIEAVNDVAKATERATSLATKHSNVVAGDNVEVTTDTNANGGNEYTVSVNKDLTDMTSATFGSGDTRNAIDKGGVRVFDDSVNTGVTANGMVIENTDTLEQASYTGSGMQASDDNGTVRFTTSNIDAGNQIVHGVKAGVADTDAVNVKQLKDYMSSNDKDTVTTVKAGNRIKVTNTGHDYTVALDDKTIDQINTTETGMKGNARDIAKLKVDVVEAKTSVSVGDGLNVKPSFNANGSTNYHVTLDSKVTDQIKDNKDAIKANSDKIADNKARIDDLANKVGTTNNNISRTISENQKEARRGIASASALAAMHPLDYDPEHKVDVMAGVGHFKGTTAVAIGAAYRPNENLMFTVGASINGSASTLNAGVSYKVGTDAKDTYHSKASMMNKIKQLETTVEEQNAQIEKLMKIVDTLVPANH